LDLREISAQSAALNANTNGGETQRICFCAISTTSKKLKASENGLVVRSRYHWLAPFKFVMNTEPQGRLF